MIYRELPLEEGASLGQTKPWAYVKNMSSMHLGKNDFSLVDLNQVLEARFFDEQQEIRLIREAGTLKAFVFTAESDDDCIISRGKPLSGFGSGFTKRSYIQYDGDGQAYIAAVCLAGWEE